LLAHFSTEIIPSGADSRAPLAEAATTPLPRAICLFGSRIVWL
jgi:hypothetical protein